MTISTIAQFAQAAYANFVDGMNGTNFVAALQAASGGFSSTQATRFATDHSVVLQYNDDGSEIGATGTSLSLTVFRETTGNLTLALRGSLELVDFTLTDNQVLVRGAGHDQIAALYNWWLRAKASSTL